MRNLTAFGSEDLIEIVQSWSRLQHSHRPCSNRHKVQKRGNAPLFKLKEPHEERLRNWLLGVGWAAGCPTASPNGGRWRPSLPAGSRTPAPNSPIGALFKACIRRHPASDRLPQFVPQKSGGSQSFVWYTE